MTFAAVSDVPGAVVSRMRMCMVSSEEPPHRWNSR